MKRLYTLVLGAAALVAVQGCSKEAALYLGGPPGPAAELALSNSNVTMMIGDSVAVGVRAQDAVGNATADAVSLSACGGVAAVTGSGSSQEWTTTAYIKGAAMGTSCVLAQAAGITDTVLVTVGPAAVGIVGSDTLLSGTGGTYTATFFDGSGSDITGTVPLTWSSSNTGRLVIGEPTGEAQARSPGSLNVQLYAPGGANTLKKVVVVTGVFGGTLSATSGMPGGLITVTRAADGQAFDDDTQVKLGSVVAYVDAFSSNALSFAIPATGSTASQTLGFSNLGPGQVAQNGSFTPTLASADKYQPGNLDATCNGPASAPTWAASKSAGNAVYIVHNGADLGSRGCQNGGAGDDHYFIYTTPSRAVSMTVEAYWTLSGDNDIYICTTDFLDDANGETCPGQGYSGESFNELDAADVPLAPNTSYFIIFSPWTGNSGSNNIQLKVLVN